MVLPTFAPSSKVNLLPKGTASLALWVPPAEPGTLFVLGENGGMSVSPDAGFEVVFGRNEPEVHVCVGGTDDHVSRLHGIIRRERSRWMLNNLGQLPIRLHEQKVAEGSQVELPSSFSRLFIRTPRHEHMLEVRIAAKPPPPRPGDVHQADTVRPGVWALTDEEHLIVVCLAQRYLRNEPYAQPETWAQVSNDLSVLRPAGKWGTSRIAHIVENVRKRLSPYVPGLLEREVPPPVGNTLNHNLITELLVTTTIREPDLQVLNEDAD